MHPKIYIALFLTLLNISGFAQPKIKLDTFTRPVPNAIDISHDGFTSRLFIADQSGRIFVFDSNGVKLDTFIDIRTKVQFNGEEGLLGVAFHPDYRNNGYFYVYYTKKNTTDNAVFRYKVSSNPNRANRDSELLVINLPHPVNTNHNGGCLKFGNDSYLYISVGDGGSGDDPPNNAQNKNTVLGKILRIDVNNFSTTYTIPASNPFFNETNVRKEIWAYGLRNVWRFSFDRQTHDMWQADVGQGNREEVNFQAANSTGGENYGWRCYEGNRPNITTSCGSVSSYVFPVFEYDHGPNGGSAITGGFVYRGNKYKDLKGYYICADFSSNNFWVIKKDENIFTSTALGKPLSGLFMSSFGEDIRGELYATNIVNGVVYKIRELCSNFSIAFSQTNHPTCYTINNGSLQISSTSSNGNVSYTWSNGNTGNTLSNLAAGKYVVTATDAIGCIRKDSVILTKPDTIKINLLSITHPSCPNVSNGSVEVAGSGGTGTFSYSWSNGITTALNQDLQAGKYIITVKDANNCSRADSFNLVNLDTLDKPVISANGMLLSTDTGFLYQWKNNGIDITDAQEDTLRIAQAGNYQVEITDANGCKAISAVFDFAVNIKNNNSAVQIFSLYPNPANDNLTIAIRLHASKQSILKIINPLGQVLYEEVLQGKEFLKNISLSFLAKGYYELSIITNDGQISSKAFVKE